MEKQNNRLVILDTLRGLAIILMVLHHFLFDITYMFSPPPNSQFWKSFFDFCKELTLSDLMIDILQPFFQCLFVLISGIACRYSRSNLKRGIKASVIAAGLSLITVIILPAIDKNSFYGCEIYFGIIHLLGISMILWALCEKGFDRLCENKLLNIALPVLLAVIFVVFYIVSSGFYEIKGLFWLGLPSTEFYSADYFPLLPWTALFFIGCWVGKYIKNGCFPHWFYRLSPNPISFVGKHTLIIYLLHQPVVFGACYLIFEILL